MRWTRLASLVLAIAAASCAADGGSSGTGITTAEGNVVAIERPGPVATPRADVAGITVGVEGTDALDTTDAGGRFAVRGGFDGRATLVFRRADDALEARMEIDVPRGGTLTLPDVRLDAGAGRATAERPRAVFDALVDAVDCPGATLTLLSVDHADADAWYTLRLDGSRLHDAAGVALACADVHAGARVRVEALVNDDLSFGDADVEVEP